MNKVTTWSLPSALQGLQQLRKILSEIDYKQINPFLNKRVKVKTPLSILSLTSVNLIRSSHIKLIDWLSCNQVGYKQFTEIAEKACNFFHPSDRNYSSEV